MGTSMSYHELLDLVNRIFGLVLHRKSQGGRGEGIYYIKVDSFRRPACRSRKHSLYGQSENNNSWYFKQGGQNKLFGSLNMRKNIQFKNYQALILC